MSRDEVIAVILSVTELLGIRKELVQAIEEGLNDRDKGVRDKTVVMQIDDTPID
jgi:hypothetical protein